MINPPDELLEDLQTNFPPAAQPLSDGAVNGHTSPGHDHLESHYYDKFEGEEHSRGYISPPVGQKQQDSRAGMPQVSHHSVIAYLIPSYRCLMSILWIVSQIRSITSYLMWMFLVQRANFDTNHFNKSGLRVASFPGPAQLSVACSTVKQERAWYLFSREWRQDRKGGRKGLIVCGRTGPRTAKRAKVQGSLPHVPG